MAQDYKHISIEEDEEEEVFMVGARAVKPELVPDFVAEPVSEAPAAPKMQASPAPVAAAAPANELEVPPMSMLQKVIIGLAVVGVVVLVAYLIMG